MAPLKVACLIVLVLGVAAILHLTNSLEPTTVYEPPIEQITPASPVPWRDAGDDMTNWFPGATQYHAHDVILSDKRAQLRAQLGRELNPGEMELHTYLVMSNKVQLGTVITRRVKGVHGAIEMAVGIDPQGKLKSLKIQRIREPEEIIKGLAEYHLEDRFVGFSVTNDFTAGNGTRNSAHELAQAVAAEVKGSLVLYAAGNDTDFSQTRHH